MEIRGTAHPPAPPGGGRGCAADLSAAEIRNTNIGGRPLLDEHDANARVGTCLASWPGSNGELRIAARVDDPTAQRHVRNGTLRGLSLGTDMILDEGGDVLFRGQAELSLCAEGKRPNTWVDTINGKTVHRQHRASQRLSVMTDSAPDQHAAAPVADANRDELVERLKRENAALMEHKAQADARASAFEAKERTRVAAWQPDVKAFLNDFVMNECCADDAEAKADVQAVVNWGEEYATKADIASQTSLARVCAVASKGVKRYREDASQLAGVQDSLANALKENEELKAQAEKLQRESTDDKKLLDERQAMLQKLNARIAELGGEQQAFNFSNAAAREVAPPAEPAAAIKPEAGLTAVAAQASKAAGNPTAVDSLFSFISSSGSGSLRMGASNTNHALLGNAGEPDIAAILRSGKQPMI